MIYLAFIFQHLLILIQTIGLTAKDLIKFPLLVSVLLIVLLGLLLFFILKPVFMTFSSMIQKLRRKKKRSKPIKQIEYVKPWMKLKS